MTNDPIVTLYHGTSANFDVPDLKMCKKNGREFGAAFYLTNSIELAHHYGNASAAEKLADSYYIYKYEIDSQYFCCKLEFSKKKCEMWKKFVRLCQTSEETEENAFYRVIIGSLSEEISHLSESELKQWALKTEKILSVDRLRLVSKNPHKRVIRDIKGLFEVLR